MSELVSTQVTAHTVLNGLIPAHELLRAGSGGDGDLTVITINSTMLRHAPLVSGSMRTTAIVCNSAVQSERVPAK